MIVKKIFFLPIAGVLLFCFVIFFFNAEAQEREPLPCLTNYRIPLNNRGAVIGKAVFPGQNDNSYVLLKDTAKLFRIDKNGDLSLRKNKQIKTEFTVFKYGITVGNWKTKSEFELVKDEFIHNRIIAHAGAWKNHPGSQNSLSSLKSAIRIGCEGSEFDVRLSCDGEPVIIHNTYIKGLTVKMSTAAEIQKIPLENGDFVPTLRQYIMECKKQNKTHLVLEIKESEMTIGEIKKLTDKIVTMVYDLRAQGWMEYISFSYESLKEIRRLDSTAEISLVFSVSDPASTEQPVKKLVLDGISGIDYHMISFFKDKSLIERAHKAGLSVNVWTVTSPKDIYFFDELNIDKITTDEPETMICLYRRENR